jgi:L-threonylcarbamoyladenylate synthase
MPRIIPFSAAAVAQAAAIIRAGHPVAVPTETVYGLAADATSGEAVARIYAAKGRPAFNPLIVHVADLGQADRIAHIGDQARALAERFWPGPLTLVLPLRSSGSIAALATAGLETVAIRMPAHPAMQALIAAADRPLAAPSANASGTISPTRAAHVAASLAGRIDLVIDGGATAHGLESTIAKVDASGVTLLRPGPVTADILAAAIGQPLREPDARDPLEAPGQLAAHYAPRKPLRLDAVEARAGEWLIGFGAVPGHVSLSASGDPVEAAARLFDLLHAADAGSAKAIAVAPVPMAGLGAAINDRLRRAAIGSGR